MKHTIIAWLGMAFGFGALIWAFFIAPSPDPIPPLEALSGPAYVGDQVVVGITENNELQVAAEAKCNLLDVPIRITGWREWRRLDKPGGEPIIIQTSGIELPPGCTSPQNDWFNPIPLAVLEAGGTWIHQGFETALDPFDSSRTDEAFWKTEPFMIGEST